MAKQVLAVMEGFDYSSLESSVAALTRTTALRIRDNLKGTLLGIIAVGKDLVAIKEALPHGQFGLWLAAEFGWTDRTARNLMSVAEQFGKAEIISDLHIQPTAAYLLAAPSTPDDARLTALERAAAGERITTAVARDIVAHARTKTRTRPVLPDKLGSRLMKVLDQYRQQWDPERLSEYVHYLREFVNQLETTANGSRMAKQ